MHIEEVKRRLSEIKSYSEEFGLNLNRKEDRYKWFIASILFAKRISSKIAAKTFRKFMEEDLTNPKNILSAGWNRLVEILDLGGYVRYDFSTATNILEAVRLLIEKYDGDIDKIHQRARDPKDLERRLMEFKGIGPTATNIFLRELRGIWTKADPKPTSLVILAAKNLGIIKSEKIDAAKRELEDFWRQNVVEGYDFVNFETALLRVGKDYCRKRKCKVCELNVYCKIYHR